MKSKTAEPKPKSKSSRGTETEGYEADYYRKKGCIVQKVYLRATYAPMLVARPGDFFAVEVLDDNGKPVLTKTGKVQKKGSVDIIAICPDGVHVCTVTSIKDDKQSFGPLYLRERNLDRAIPVTFPVKADSACYIRPGKQNVRRRHRDEKGEWHDENPSLASFGETKPLK